ncbi:hypothetical protein LOS20_02460 [Enterococcus faecium]|nr:hypothetical protein [Enterococcus faecium]
MGSNKSGELGAKLIVSAENNTIVEKAVSGIYVPYNKNKVVSASKFENIQLNKDFTTKKPFRNLVNQMRYPNIKILTGKQRKLILGKRIRLDQWGHTSL